MAKALKTVGTIAGAVALVALAATGVGAALLPAGFTYAVGGVTVGTIATVSGAIAGAANVGASALAKPPPARGAVTNLLIAPDVPQPYVMGEGYYAGVLRHDAAYGATLNDVPSPYRGMVVVYSGGAPIASITPYVDKAAVSAWYSGYLYTDTQLGATPESAALSPNFAGLPGWDASSKLSGQAAILWNLKFDKKGKRFASGVPQIGAYGQWVKAYDPRLDSTFPGGSGAHRVDDETTWEWTDNPALHFGTYAYGRHQNGVRTIGCGLTSIDWGVIAAWANVCEANDWTIFGVVYEPGNRWDNLKDIAAAGGAVPVVSSGGMLSVKYWAPQVSLDTITAADIAEGQVTYSPLQSWDERVNTIVPRYTSADHEWNQVAAEPVAIAGFVTEDGEEKRKEWPYNLVKDAGQAAQLAAYQIYEGREVNPIVIPCLPRLRAYRPGECLTLDLPDYGLEMDAVILQRQLDPASLTVTLTLIGETPAKHAAALGQTPAPPATPVAGQDGEDRDETTYDTGANPPRTVADEAALLALDVPVGTVVKRLDNNQTYFYNGGTSGTIADWTVLATSIPNGVSAFMQTVLDDADAATARATLGLTIGTDVQAYDADLTTWAGITPGTGVGTALGVNVGSAGSFVVNGGVLGTPSSGNLANCTFPTLNQNTTGSAATLTTTRTIWGQNFNGSANVSGALSGATTGAFSGAVTTGGLTATTSVSGTGVTITGTVNPCLVLQNNGVTEAFFGVATAINGIVSGSAVDDIGCRVNGGAMLFSVDSGASALMKLSGTTVDVAGLVQCNSLRIDQTPTAATPTPTHTFTISLNGTTYRVPCVV